MAYWVQRPSFIGKVTGSIPADSQCVSIKSRLSSPNVLQQDTEPLPAHPLSLRLTATYLKGKNIQTLDCEPGLRLFDSK